MTTTNEPTNVTTHGTADDSMTFEVQVLTHEGAAAAQPVWRYVEVNIESREFADASLAKFKADWPERSFRLSRTGAK